MKKSVMKVQKNREDKSEMLARLIKEQGEENQARFDEISGKLDEKADKEEMREEFAKVHRRLDTIVQPQLDSHAH